MDGVKPPTVHALKHHEMPTRIRDRHRNGDARGLRALQRDRGYMLGPLVSETLCGGDVHDRARLSFCCSVSFALAEEDGTDGGANCIKSRA